MNERIKELGAQARASIEKGLAFEIGFALYTEKFAELLVKESALFLNGAVEVYTQAEQDACDRAAQGLKQHFGVE